MSCHKIPRSYDDAINRRAELNRRRRWSRRRREELLESMGPKCAYCGRETPKESATIDHVEPVSRGGKDRPGNLVYACRACNESKRDLPMDAVVIPHTRYLRGAIFHLRNAMGGEPRAEDLAAWVASDTQRPAGVKYGIVTLAEVLDRETGGGVE